MFVTTQETRRRNQSQITIFSPAKLNFFLKILGRRSDGYHDLETIMVPLKFGDEITLQLRKTSIVVESDHPTLPIDDKNLALKAAKLFDEHCSFEKGVKIQLKKRIPLAAGLGGGSSNAASVLIGLNQLWKAGTDTESLSNIALNIGSDVPFFVHETPAICRGKGEIIEPISCHLKATVLLVNPGFGIPTKWAYDHWANNKGKSAFDPALTLKPSGVSLLLQGLKANDIEAVSRCLFNSLEEASIGKFPILKLIKESLNQFGAVGSLMSGSGATVFGLFAEKNKAHEASLKIREQFGPSTWVHITQLMYTE